jgi:predicted ATPase/DNA-binding SARP family transcriptional activator
VEFGILGPLAVWKDGDDVPIRAAKQRALLAVLLLRRNELVPTERLIDDLWGERPPATATKTVQVYVSQLRKTIGDGLLETGPDGYVLRLEAGVVDLDAFEDLLARGRRLLGEGSAGDAATLLRHALDLWRGPALADFRYDAFARDEIGRLEELRLVALEQRLEADLALGRHAEAVPELEALIREHPLRENLRLLLMLALYRSGRQADALAAYRDARSVLLDELGLDPSESLQELETAILRHDPALLPPLMTRRRTNLPVPATALVGRARELNEFGALLEQRVRLLTLTGPGGVGKTRLALAAGAELSAQFADGVWWVPLASVDDVGFVLAELGQALGLDGEPGREPGEQLAGVLSGMKALLLFDNAEHLMPEVAEVIGAILRLSGPTVLVTSRERLGLAGEQVYAVLPLSEAEGVELFLARARALDPGFERSEALEELCERLDYLPLALELAAARTAVISPDQILARIAGRLDLLKGTRDGDPRQRTLRSTITWSYELLDPGERELFAALSVFSGGCSLEAAEAICDAELDTLGSLVDKSLVRRSGERFWMLETIREFAAERLAESKREDGLRDRHAEYFERLAHEGEVALRTTAQQHWREILAVEQPNIRAAIQWSLDHGGEARALRTATSLYRFWGKVSGAEARLWLDRVLATGAGTSGERAKASFVAGQIAFLHGEMGRAIELLEEAILLSREASDVDVLATSLGYCSWAMFEHGDRERSAVLLAECRKLLPELDDPAVTAEVLTSVASVTGSLGDFETAERLYRDVLELERGIGDEISIGDALNNIGWAATGSGRLADAIASLEESLAISRRLGDDVRATMAIGNLGLAALAQKRWDDAVELLLEELRLSNRTGNRRCAAEAIVGLAVAHSGLADERAAAKLYGAFQNLCEATGIDPSVEWLSTIAAQLVDRVQARLDPATIEALTEQGRSLTPEQVLELLESRFGSATTPGLAAGDLLKT